MANEEEVEKKRKRRRKRKLKPGTSSEYSLLIDILVNKAEMSPKDISEALGCRVSERTVYRWWKRESKPQQKSDIEALQTLVDKNL